MELAPIVRRRTPTFPSRMANYFDLTKWGGGYLRCGGGPGAIELPNGMRCDICSGTVVPAPINQLKEASTLATEKATSGLFF